MVTSVAGESDERRARRKQLTSQLDILANGSETCKRFMVGRLKGTYDTVLIFKFGIVGVGRQWLMHVLWIDTHVAAIDRVKSRPPSPTSSSASSLISQDPPSDDESRGIQSPEPETEPPAEECWPTPEAEPPAEECCPEPEAEPPAVDTLDTPFDFRAFEGVPRPVIEDRWGLPLPKKSKKKGKR